MAELAHFVLGETIMELNSARVNWVGIVCLLAGLVTVGLAFPGAASAGAQAAASTAACATNSWTDTVTVTNSPDASTGVATITGTGTTLDGTTLAAGGGHRTIVLSQPLAVASVTVSGELSWPGGYHAPFATTATQPDTCAGVPAQVAAAGVNPNAAPDKVYVCKYVGSPGVDERLQTGQNPILVSVNAIPQNPVVPGSYFADSQGRSFVLAFDTGQTPPTADDCPGGTPPTATVTATSTVPGPTVTVTGPTTTITVTVPVTATATVTTPGPTVTIPGPTTTVSVPGPTVTLTETATQTITNSLTQTVTNTVTSTAPGPTATVTLTQPGGTVTVTQPGATVTLPGNTVTVTQPGPTVTLPGATATVTQTLDGTLSTVTERVTDTVTVMIDNGVAGAGETNCPPGAAVQAGSLAYTGAGNDATMSLLGGALTAGGLVCLIMARKRRAGRQH
jgi:hypothetical protein